MTQKKHKFLHVVPVAIKGGSSIMQKYLDYKKVFEKLNVEYVLVIITPKFFHSKFIETIENDPKIYIIESKYVNQKCIFKRTMINALKPLDEIILKEKPTNIIIRLGMLDSAYLQFIKKYNPIVEQASAPLEINFISAPLYEALAKKHMDNVFKNTKLMIGCLRYFNEFYPKNKDKLYIMHNSVNIPKYKKRRFTHKNRKNSYNILLMSAIYSKYSYSGYDRLLKGLQSYLKDKRVNKKINFYVLGNDIKGFKELLNKNKIFLDKSRIKFHYLGFKTIKELNSIVKKMDIGINDLAGHRQKIKSVNAIKTLDFLGWNLPFIIAGDDENLIGYKESFYKKFPLGDKAIDFQDVLDFMNKIKKRDFLDMEVCKVESSLEKRLSQLLIEIEKRYK